MGIGTAHAYGGAKGGEQFMTPTNLSVLPAREDNASLRVMPESSGERFLVDELERARAEAMRLKGLCDEAQQKVDELREAVAARDDFIATAGHELRNPMAGLVLGVHRLRFHGQCAGEAPAWLSPLLRELDRQICNYVSRATMLLDVSLLAAGRLSLDLGRVKMDEIVEGVVNEMAAEGERSRCRVEISVGQPVDGWWDRAALKRIATNLLSNAIKYGAGYPIDVCVSSCDGSALLRVRDHGIGISPEDRGRVFERFERALSKNDHAGFGLGLWVARQLALAHGGEIAVESAPGIGSTFTLILPRNLPEPTR
jgi:signal transduction histidine kinase